MKITFYNRPIFFKSVCSEHVYSMKLKGDEELTEFLLNQLVTRHVRGDDLRQFAAHLKISTAEYDNIRHDFHGNTKEIKWRVCSIINSNMPLPFELSQKKDFYYAWLPDPAWVGLVRGFFILPLKSSSTKAPIFVRHVE